MSQTPPLRLPPGTLIRQYRIRRLVGAGGFGAVYEAEVTSAPGHTVALKETHAAGTLAAFQHEWTVLRALRHPNLPLYDEVFAEAGRGYLVMEFVSGQDLEAVLTQGRVLTEAQVLGYALQLCDVLAYLHQQRPAILHRDIKPANIRITPEGLLKLVDFGLVKRSDQATQTVLRGAGSPAYAPLEQYGGAAHTDVRSDIYSLGATLYHLLTGQEPPPAVVRSAQSADPLVWPHRATQQRISFAVSEAIVTALALRKDERYPDSLQFKQALLGSGTQPRPGATTGTDRPDPATGATITLTGPPVPAPTAPPHRTTKTAPPAPSRQAVPPVPPPPAAVRPARPAPGPARTRTAASIPHPAGQRWRMGFAIGWATLGCVGWIIGLLLSAVGVGFTVVMLLASDTAPTTAGFVLLLAVLGLVLGGSLGLAQGGLLTGRVSLPGWWLIMAIGWAAGVPAGVLAWAIAAAQAGLLEAGAAAGFSVGALTGSVQWLALRGARAQWAGWWLLATLLCWPLAGVLAAAWYARLMQSASVWPWAVCLLVAGLIAQSLLGVVVGWIVPPRA
jgi:serine/threonine-protein kinase